MNIIDRSSLKTKNGLPYFEIRELSKTGWLQHAFLSRQGGVSSPPYDSLNLSDDNGDKEERVSNNKSLIARAFDFDPGRLVLLRQSHQDQILWVREPLTALAHRLEYDAMITDCPNIFLGILTADCLPIFVADRKRKVIAAIHSGRAGTGLGITTKVLRRMKTEFGCLSENLLIALGPSIGPCCYEIDAKVFRPEWESFSIPKGGGRWNVDLVAINIDQMKKEGIREEQIFRIDLCTSCHRELFFSYRGEGQTGRQLSFIGITK
ncbi:MAG: peptidoglycan editing factor PgeF [Syntrophaceae bacterium]|nr:peptidoglycan editing factor PgeF [Syntrophaceae bacterium]